MNLDWRPAADALSLWPILALIGLPTLAFLLYRRQVRHLDGPLRAALPLLRAATLLVLALMLIRPALQGTRSLDRIGRLVLLVDASPSMGERDGGEASRLDRARAIAQELALAVDRRVAVETIDVSAGATTDLLAPLLDVQPDETPTTIVLLTDGRQTAAGPEQNVAAALAERGVVASGVLFGGETSEPNATLLDLSLPAEVQREGRLVGSAVVDESLPAGIPYTLSLRAGDGPPWTLPLESLGEGRRVIELDLAAADLADESGLVLGRASTSDDPDAPAYPFALRVTDRPTRVVVLDGRPRWETRQLSASLDRQEGVDVAAGLQRDTPAWQAAADALGEAPAIVLGELTPDDFSAEQRAALGRAVRRGSGVIWVDGSRGLLAEIDADDALSPLLPVRRGRGPAVRVERLRLTAAGREAAALRLLPDADANAALWERLPPPSFAVDAEAAPDFGVVLAEAVANDGTTRPFIVSGTVGRGSVWYVGGDEFWRWRRGVGDRWQNRLWTGLARAALRPPSMASDDDMTLYFDAAPIVPGASIDVRVELAQPNDAALSVALRRDDQTLAAVPLEGEADRVATLRAPSEAGRWSVVVLRNGEAALEADLAVIDAAAYDELATPVATPLVLRPIVDATGGLLADEEDLTPLIASLARPSEQAQATRRYELWASWPLLLLVATLLTIEWALRRRGGLA